MCCKLEHLLMEFEPKTCRGVLDQANESSFLHELHKLGSKIVEGFPTVLQPLECLDDTLLLNLDKTHVNRAVELRRRVCEPVLTGCRSCNKTIPLSVDLKFPLPKSSDVGCRNQHVEVEALH